MQLSASAVLALAPDASSASAAKGLLSPGKWGDSLGFSERAVWGACQGSGSKPYQTQVDISGAAPSFKCSCPSRKQPCKHGLGLMLLRADSAQLFKSNGEPAWVSQWLDSRQERAQKKQEKAEAIASDPKAAAAAAAAAAKREDGRWQRIEDGTQDLQKFLCDQVAQGLASLSAANAGTWERMAARMVDAQAPALGEVLKDCAAQIGRGEGWPRQVLHRMGRLQLCIEAVRRREQLSEPLRRDLQAALGWAVSEDVALAAGDKVEDDWIVTGCVHRRREGNITERRVWLHGAASRRRALVLDYSHGDQGFKTAWLVGQCARTTLAYYPSASPLRAVPATTVDAADARTLPGHAPAQEFLAMAQHCSANPFGPLWPMLLADIAVVREANQWSVHFDDQGTRRAMPLLVGDEAGWDLLSMSAGLDLSLAGEWDGQALRATCAASSEGVLALLDRSIA